MIGRVFLDTNVMLDLLGRREPFYSPIAKIATLAEDEKLEIYVSAISFATVSYFLAKFENQEIMREKLRKFRIICKVVELNDVIIDKGLNSKFKDFEDSLQYYSALQANCTTILTRNQKDFKLAKIAVLNAEEYLKSLGYC